MRTEKEFIWAETGSCAPILTEQTALLGIREIAEKTAKDVERVTGILPPILHTLPEQAERIVLYATLGSSPLLDQLFALGKIPQKNQEAVLGKREVYAICLVENPWEKIGQALVVYGSDKRGTIYGMFELSKIIGVSPLYFWGDVSVKQKSKLVLTNDVEQISKEPSVKYRGFFINDEWPCFGNWTFSHFGGFTAEMYDHVFELLLRLKGNYLWPAMWTSSFALDGPGEESARLANLYGVIMGNSHHEPCLRASEEWDIYKGCDTDYGCAWNYVVNKEGLLRYWEDGLKRGSKYENIVTVGMRGERDSMMQGVNSLQENINVLKEIITRQEALITKYADTEDEKMPRLLAVYKEVEDYFYGDERTEGLKNWEGLRDIILMFCEDNFGNMRFLPDPKEKHPGGYGMYYHLDYHGDPISYEWINTTPLSKIWEQMSECYEYGVRDVWMLNVGDLKGNEFPLSYFLDLAYDFDKWGITNPDSAKLYTKEWIQTGFGAYTGEEVQEELAEVLTRGIWLSHLKRPEALQSDTFHPVHYHEADWMLKEAKKIKKRLKLLQEQLPKEAQNAFYSMIANPLFMGMNLIEMQLYAGKNAHYAKQGKKAANDYASLVTKAIEKDREYAKRYGDFLEGKWSGMEREAHIGFQKWNDDGCKYPLRMLVEPQPLPRLIVSRSDGEAVYVKNYGTPECIEVREFLYPGNTEVEIELANDGMGSLECEIQLEACQWLEVSERKVTVETQKTISLKCNREKLPKLETVQPLLVRAGDAEVQILVFGKRQEYHYPDMTFIEQEGILVIPATKWAVSNAAPTGSFQKIMQYGKYSSAIKAFPVTQHFALGEGPSVTYFAAVEKAGNYVLKLLSAPSNPLFPGGRLYVGVSVNAGEARRVATVSETYIAGKTGNEEWSKGVLDQIHETELGVYLKKGSNTITVYAMEPGVVLERLILVRTGEKIKSSYLGPQESYCVWYNLA